MAAWPAGCVSPTTFGTRTGAGPEDTTRLTAEAFGTEVPGAGVWLMPWPATMVSLDTFEIVPAVRLLDRMVACAAAWVSPTTFGTRTGAGPADTTKLTAVPLATKVPAAGVSLMTWPAAIVWLATL